MKKKNDLNRHLTRKYIKMEIKHMNTKIRLIIFLSQDGAKDGKALYSQQTQDWDLTVAQIMNSLLPNSDLH